VFRKKGGNACINGHPKNKKKKKSPKGPPGERVAGSGVFAKTRGKAGGLSENCAEKKKRNFKVQKKKKHKPKLGRKGGPNALGAKPKREYEERKKKPGPSTLEEKKHDHCATNWQPISRGEGTK